MHLTPRKPKAIAITGGGNAETTNKIHLYVN